MSRRYAEHKFVEPKAGVIEHRAFSGNMVRAIDDEKRSIDFIISTEAPDRYRDIIRVSGWDLKNYRRNPQVLYGHNSWGLPIGKSPRVWKEDDALKATAIFMGPDLNPLADAVFNMYKEGFLRAVSVGFRPLKWQWLRDDEDEDVIVGIDFLKQELLEFSAVPIPANPEALIDAKRKGINVEPIHDWSGKILDQWVQVGKDLTQMFGFNRKDFEMANKSSSSKGQRTTKTVHLSPEQEDALRQRNLQAIKDGKKSAEAEGNEETVENEITLDGIVGDLELVDEGELKDVKAGKSDDGGVLLTDTPERTGINQEVIERALTEDGFHAHVVKNSNGGYEFVITGENMTASYLLVGVTEKGAVVGELISIEEEPSEVNVDALRHARGLITSGGIDAEGTIDGTSEEDNDFLGRSASIDGAEGRRYQISKGGKVFLKALEAAKRMALKRGDDGIIAEIDGLVKMAEETKSSEDPEESADKDAGKAESAEKQAEAPDGGATKSDDEGGADDPAKGAGGKEKELSESDKLDLHMEDLETTLTDIEELLDADAHKKLSKHQRRKLEFLGTYMSELSGRFNPNTVKRQVRDADSINRSSEPEGYSDEEITEAIVNVAGPLIDKAVTAAVDKLTGKLPK